MSLNVHNLKKLEFDGNSQPVVHPPRKVPVAIKDQLQTELNRLCDMNIITPVTKPTPLVSSLVTMEKRNQLRVCIDPKHLNQHIKRRHYPLHTIYDLLPELLNANIFSVVDAKNLFCHVQLDDVSSYLSTFDTHFGSYRWLRSPLVLLYRQKNISTDKIRQWKVNLETHHN
ncbi:unnamed protein product [Mytilus edulis]|uniref:Reverse transcriptase domain-containing protein n=1 Tax=Mytilus edulis TaxID=6550 RepID=A0A8S3RL28_MYTED|nr:unnamed protein product [Mytilus edulis]